MSSREFVALCMEDRGCIRNVDFIFTQADVYIGRDEGTNIMVPVCVWIPCLARIIPYDKERLLNFFFFASQKVLSPHHHHYHRNLYSVVVLFIFCPSWTRAYHDPHILHVKLAFQIVSLNSVFTFTSIILYVDARETLNCCRFVKEIRLFSVWRLISVVLDIVYKTVVHTSMVHISIEFSSLYPM